MDSSIKKSKVIKKKLRLKQFIYNSNFINNIQIRC